MTVREESLDALAAHASIPCAFRVESQLRVIGDPGTSAPWMLVEGPVATPFIKDYDAQPDNRPVDWPRRFDTRRWRLFSAFVQGLRVGGAILIPGREGAAVPGREVMEVWDLRVVPAARRQGVGRALWAAVEAAAVRAGAAALLVETQQVNVAACRFYQACGCELSTVEPDAYPTLPGEIKLTWHKSLLAPGHASPLVAIKTFHTAVWGFFVASIIGIPLSASIGRFDWALGLAAIVFGEVLVLAFNQMRCPLTAVAARHTADRRPNFDIYLPAWLARYNKEIFGTLYVLGILYALARWRGWLG